MENLALTSNRAVSSHRDKSVVFFSDHCKILGRNQLTQNYLFHSFLRLSEAYNPINVAISLKFVGNKSLE